MTVYRTMAITILCLICKCWLIMMLRFSLFIPFVLIYLMPFMNWNVVIIYVQVEFYIFMYAVESLTIRFAVIQHFIYSTWHFFLSKKQMIKISPVFTKILALFLVIYIYILCVIFYCVLIWFNLFLFMC